MFNRFAKDDDQYIAFALLKHKVGVFAIVCHQLAEEVQGAVRGKGARHSKGQLGVLSYRAGQLPGFHIADTDDVEGVVLELLLDEFVKSSVVFKTAIDTLKIFGSDGIGKRDGNPEFNGGMRVKTIRVQQFAEMLVRLVTQPPVDKIITAHIKEEEEKQQDREALFQGGLGFASDTTKFTA